MGNCFSFRIVFPLQNSSRPPVVEYRDECPICLRITSCWKKLHPSDGDQPPILFALIAELTSSNILPNQIAPFASAIFTPYPLVFTTDASAAIN